MQRPREAALGELGEVDTVLVDEPGSGPLWPEQGLALGGLVWRAWPLLGPVKVLVSVGVPSQGHSQEMLAVMVVTALTSCLWAPAPLIRISSA